MLVVRGSPIHYLLVRANNYPGQVGLVDTVDDAVKQLHSASGGSRHGDDDDGGGGGGDLVFLTDAAVADYVASRVRFSTSSCVTCFSTIIIFVHHKMVAAKTEKVNHLRQIPATLTMIGLSDKHGRYLLFNNSILKFSGASPVHLFRCV